MHRRGLFLLVALAASVGSVGVCASAQAAPEYGTCVKVSPKSSGRYSDKNCEDSVAGTGAYEWVPGPAADPGYTSKSKVVAFSTPSETGLRCRRSTDVGEITGLTSGLDTIMFTGCESQGRACASEGQPAGTVRSYELATTLEEVGGTVVVSYAGDGPEVGGEHLLMAFACETVGGGQAMYRIRGFTTGKVSPIDVMGGKETLAIAGEEQLLVEFSLDGGAEWLGPFSVEADTAVTDKSATKMELRDL
jgi:hypothetical protein